MKDSYSGALLLPDNRIFLGSYAATTARIFDYARGKITVPAGTYTLGYHRLRPIFLADGRIFIGPAHGPTAWIYDWEADTLTACAPTFPMSANWESFCQALLLTNGKVYLVPNHLTSAYIYDPVADSLTAATGTFPVAPDDGASSRSCAFLLNDGTVYIVPGGLIDPPRGRIYDPVADTLTVTTDAYVLGAVYFAVPVPDAVLLLNISDHYTSYKYTLSTNALATHTSSMGRSRAGVQIDDYWVITAPYYSPLGGQIPVNLGMSAAYSQYIISSGENAYCDLIRLPSDTLVFCPAREATFFAYHPDGLKQYLPANYKGYPIYRHGTKLSDGKILCAPGVYYNKSLYSIARDVRTYFTVFDPVTLTFTDTEFYYSYTSGEWGDHAFGYTYVGNFHLIGDSVGYCYKVEMNLETGDATWRSQGDDAESIYLPASGKIFHTSGVLLDTTTWTAITVGSFHTSYYYFGMMPLLLPDNSVLMIPGHTDYPLLVVNPLDGTVIQSAMFSDETGIATPFANAILLQDGLVFFCPYNCTHAYFYNVATNTLTAATETFLGDAATGAGIQLSDGRILLNQSHYPDALLYYPDEDRAEWLPLGCTLVDSYAPPIELDDGRILFLPAQAATPLILGNPPVREVVSAEIQLLTELAADVQVWDYINQSIDIPIQTSLVISLQVFSCIEMIQSMNPTALWPMTESSGSLLNIMDTGLYPVTVAGSVTYNGTAMVRGEPNGILLGNSATLTTTGLPNYVTPGTMLFWGKLTYTSGTPLMHARGAVGLPRPLTIYAQDNTRVYMQIRNSAGLFWTLNVSIDYSARVFIAISWSGTQVSMYRNGTETLYNLTGGTLDNLYASQLSSITLGAPGAGATLALQNYAYFHNRRLTKAELDLIWNAGK